MSEIPDGTRVLIAKDVLVEGRLAFSQGESVTVEQVSPDASRPEYRYVVYSAKLGDRFQLRAEDLKAPPSPPRFVQQPTTTAAPQPAPPAAATSPLRQTGLAAPPPLLPKKTIGERWSGLSAAGKVGIVLATLFILVIVIVAGVTASKKSAEPTTTETKTESQSTEVQPASTEPAATQPATATPQPATPLPAAAPPAAPTWKTVIDINGNADKRTQPFHLGSGQKRLLYNVVGDTMPVCSIYVVAAGTSLDTEGGFPEVMVTDPGPGETALAQDKGDYYLDVSAANCNWQVTVQELK